ncbi:MAG: FG-GAP-like repeat-containing protein [Gemmataceae bacterium]
MDTAALGRALRVERMEDRLAPAIIQDGVPTWLPSGPAPTVEAGTQLAGATPNSNFSQRTGAVEAITPHPTNPNIAFAGGVNGGVWRTSNATATNPTWTPLTDQLPSLSVADMAMNPDFPDSLFFGIGGTSSAFLLSGDKVGTFLSENAVSAAAPSFKLLTGGFVSTVADPVGEFPNVTSVLNRTAWLPVYSADGRTVARDGNGFPIFDQVDYLVVAGDNGLFRATRMRGRVTVDPANVRFTPAVAPSAANPAGTPELAVVLPPPGQTALGTRVSAGSLPLPPGVTAPAVYGAFQGLSGVGDLPSVLPIGTPAGTPVESVPIFQRRTIFQVVADPADARVVYVVGKAGVYRTPDITAALLTWVDVTPGRRFAVDATGASVPDADGNPTFTSDNPALTTITQQTVRVKLSVYASTSRTGPAAGDTTNSDNIVYLAINNPDPAAPNGGSSSHAKATVLWSNDARTAAANAEPAAGVATDTRTSTARWITMDEALNVTGVRAVSDVPTQVGSAITINLPGHGLATGDRVLIEGVEGVREANGVWTVTVTGNDTFTLDGSQYSTGPYVAGSGTVRLVYGVSPGNQGNIHFGLTADPTNPFLVYLGGDSQRNFGVNGPQGFVFPVGNVFRGDRRKPQQFGRVTIDDFTSDRPQYTPLMFNYTANGKANYADIRNLYVDPQGSLILGDDGGVYKRTLPQQNGGTVTSLIGNLQLGQFYRIEQDTLNEALFGGTQDTGSIQQDSGAGPAGSQGWNVFPGTGGDGFWADVDNTRKSGNVTVRYVTGNNGASSLRRQVYDLNGNQIEPISPVRFESPTDATYLAGLDASDKAVFGLNPFAINRVDGRLMLFGMNNLYEDNDKQGKAGDVVAKVNPPGLTGQITALEYGGRTITAFDPTTRRPILADVTRPAYVGTTAGDVFIRGATGTIDSFLKANLPAPTGFDLSVQDIVVDPDDYRTFYVLRANKVFGTHDFGATFTDLTGNLFANGQVDAQGNPAGGLTNKLWSLALWDGDPGYPNFDPNPLSFGRDTGNYTLLVGGNNGVFRLAPTAADSPAAPWTEFGTGLPNAVVYDLQVYGNTLVAGTQGRGAWTIPDISGTIQKRASLTITADTPTSQLSIRPDASNPTVVSVSDGTTTQSFSLGTVQDFNFKGNGASGLFVGIDGDRGPNSVIVRGGTVEFAPIGLATSRAGRVTYSGFEGGALTVDLGATAPAGNVVFVESTSARTTRLVGGPALDWFNIGYANGSLGNLNGLLGDVEVDGRGGGDGVTVSDLTAAGGNRNVILTSDGTTQTVANIGGAADTAAVRATAVGAVVVHGSDAAADVFNVRGTALPVQLLGHGGNDVVRVSSFAGDSDDGDLSGVKGAVTVDAGAGDNRLVVSHYGSPTGISLTVSDTQIVGGPAPITYLATGGRYANGSAADGLLIRGSNAAADKFTLTGSLAGSQLAIDGNGGDDQFAATADGLKGAVWLRGGAGSDKFTVSPGLSGNTADSLRLTGGGDAGDTATVVGSSGADNFGVTVTGAGAATVTGIRNPVAVDAMARVVIDGAGSNGFNRNNLTIADGTGQTFGTPTTPLAGIVYQPTGPTSGEVRFGNGSVAPVVGFTNINGSDAAGLVVNGSPTGSTGDVLTVLGSTAADSRDTFEVSDSTVVVLSTKQGPLRALAVGRTAGKASVGTLYVRAGANAGAGNVYQVTPTNAVNIVVDGVQVQGGANAGRVEVLTTDPYTITRTTDPVLGPPQSRVVTASGTGFGFLNVSKVTGEDGVGSGGRSIYAVGSDAGGGPRVRVYDAANNVLLFDKFVYDPSFTGGVRVATGDVNGDGIPDVITGAGLLGGPHVQVFDGLTFQPIANFFAYEPSFRGGVYVATGDVNGDGKEEILTGTGVGGGPLVRVFDGTGKLLTQVFPFESTFRGGVNVAAGDVNGDGRVDILATPGPGGGPVVRAYDSATLTPVAEYLAFDPSYRGGLFVAAGDLDGDGIDEIAVAPAVDGSTEVRVRRGRDGSIVALAALTDNPNDLSAGSPTGQPASLALGGVRVAIAPNATADGRGELLAVPGPGKPAFVYRYTIDPVTLVAKDDAFEPGFTGGVFIG